MARRPRRSSLAASLSAGLATPALRRVQVAWAASSLASWTFFVALAVYAYDAGGAAAVGAAAVVRMVPAGLAAPAAGVVVDRAPRRDVLLAATALRAVLVAAITVAIAADAPLALVLALAALVMVAGTVHKPAQAALLPTLAETPTQLGATCALWAGVDSAAFLGGSLATGVLIATASTDAAFGAAALLYAAAALPLAALPRDPVPEYRADPTRPGRAAALLAGARAVAGEPDLRALVGFLSLTTLVEGAVDVLVVVLAIELLDLGDAGVGWLNASWGLGGLAGGAVALALLGHGRLSTGLAAGGLMAGGALIITGVVLAPAVAVVMLVVLGAGYALVEAAGLSLLQRLSSDEVLGRAFAVVETSYWLTTGLVGRSWRPW
jgi:MFS family permease